MRRIINGFKYDTEISQEICSITVSKSQQLIIYANKNGAFFAHSLVVINEESGEVEERIIPYTKQEALNVIANSDDGIARYEKIYGEIPQAPAEAELPISAERNTVASDYQQNNAEKAYPDTNENTNSDMMSPTEENIPIIINQKPKASFWSKHKLVKACTKGNQEEANKLLESGVPPCKKAMNKAMMFKRYEIIRLFISYGYKPVADDINYAILLGDIDIFRLVLPPDNTFKMKDLIDFQMYAGKYEKADITSYLNDIMSDRKHSTE